MEVVPQMVWNYLSVFAFGFSQKVRREIQKQLFLKVHQKRPHSEDTDEIPRETPIRPSLRFITTFLVAPAHFNCLHTIASGNVEEKSIKKHWSSKVVFRCSSINRFDYSDSLSLIHMIVASVCFCEHHLSTQCVIQMTESDHADIKYLVDWIGWSTKPCWLCWSIILNMLSSCASSSWFWGFFCVLCILFLIFRLLLCFVHISPDFPACFVLRGNTRHWLGWHRCIWKHFISYPTAHKNIALVQLQTRVWHSWKFWYEWMSEYIRINKITRMNIRIYSCWFFWHERMSE